MSIKLLKQLSIMVLSIALVFIASSPTTIAADLTNRSLTIGTSEPSTITTYAFRFNIPSVSNLGSIEFQFCENDPLIGYPCTAPSGFSASSAVLSFQSGETGFTIDPISTANRIILTRPPAISSPVVGRYTFSNVTNPDDIGTYYVRLSTYASNDATGPRTDSGGLAFAMTRGLGVESFVPPYLIFCVGITVAGDCSSASGNQLNFGELSSRETKAVTSQFAGATNDPGGYSTFLNGLTMTSGTNTIPALVAPSPSAIGTSQFGMNLRANTNPAIGSDPSGVGSATVLTDFAQTNLFSFKNQIITNSPLSTDFNVFTASYMVNVSAEQKPGVYNTTLTYIATAAF